MRKGVIEMLKVAAYCRVSTDHEDQKNSLENQQLYFENYINANSDWEFAGLFPDEGITGTCMKKRKKFNEMIDKAYNGEIDLIITKEVSRFARNTVDTLSVTRKLKTLGIGVIFISDNIDTRENDGEFRLTIMASVAQEESRKTSERVKWGMRRGMEKGYVFGPGVLGFHLNKGALTVNEDEASIVKLIYQDFLSGMGITSIVKKLKQEHIPCGSNRKNWTVNNVRAILVDEKYAGDLRQRKMYIESHLTHKAVKNENPDDTVYIRNHHPAIVDHKTWDLAQLELQRRAALIGEKSRHSTKYWASGLIECGECGSKGVSRNKYNKDGTMIRFWYCRELYNYGKSSGCKSDLVNDIALLTCVRFALRQLNFNSADILQELQSEIQTAQNGGIPDHTKQYEERIKKALEKKARIIDMYAEGDITKSEMNQMKSKYDDEISALKSTIEKVRLEAKKNEAAKENLSKVIARIKEILRQEEPTPEVYRSILEKIVLCKNHDLDIYFKYVSSPIQLHFETSG
ncbi:recombinase family protein [Anoxybacterium hadale]|uniref:Recombinase family protein n=1 Tax=Anoxybacterium hadale TaxID=3408580 RepID=A0ACD1ACV1_9FIRM|nr:recombinase family protein [Clostridiales bacterium]